MHACGLIPGKHGIMQRDDKKAFELFFAAAQKGMSAAQYKVGSTSSRGRRVGAVGREARACAQGHVVSVEGRPCHASLLSLAGGPRILHGR